MDLQNKTILLTGASSGIGYELAVALAYEKCQLAILSRNLEAINKLADILKDSGSIIKTYKCDVTKKDEVAAAVKEVLKDFGELDIAILNSAVSTRSSVAEFNSAKAEEIFKTNVLGVVYFIEEILPAFMRRKSGVIVGVSSMADSRGFAKSGFYCASKSALTTLLESLRVELQHYNVKVITVKPGFVKTPMTDKNEFYMPFLMQPAKAAQIILSGIKKEKKEIRFPAVMSLLTRLTRHLPIFIYDRLSSVQLKKRQ